MEQENPLVGHSSVKGTIQYNTIQYKVADSILAFALSSASKCLVVEKLNQITLLDSSKHSSTTTHCSYCTHTQIHTDPHVDS